MAQKPLVFHSYKEIFHIPVGFKLNEYFFQCLMLDCFLFLVIFYNSSICSNVCLYRSSCSYGCLSVQWSFG